MGSIAIKTTSRSSDVVSPTPIGLNYGISLWEVGGVFPLTLSALRSHYSSEAFLNVALLSVAEHVL